MRRLPIKESPERLRECLTALAKHSQTDVVRVELRWKKNGPIVVTATHSAGEKAEMEIAKTVCACLEAVMRPEEATVSTKAKGPA